MNPLRRAVGGSAFVLALALVPALAHARVERYAVVIGNDLGKSGETPLRYAEADAERVHDVLHDLGGFEPANMVLLRGESADTVRSTVIAINERVRQAVSLPNTQAVLLLYYSGHADADDLHLGEGRLAIAELARLVRGSAAIVPAGRPRRLPLGRAHARQGRQASRRRSRCRTSGCPATGWRS